MFLQLIDREWERKTMEFNYISLRGENIVNSLNGWEVKNK